MQEHVPNDGIESLRLAKRKKTPPPIQNNFSGDISLERPNLKPKHPQLVISIPVIPKKVNIPETITDDSPRSETSSLRWVASFTSLCDCIGNFDIDEESSCLSSVTYPRHSPRQSASTPKSTVPKICEQQDKVLVYLDTACHFSSNNFSPRANKANLHFHNSPGHTDNSTTKDLSTTVSHDIEQAHKVDQNYNPTRCCHSLDVTLHDHDKDYDNSPSSPLAFVDIEQSSHSVVNK